MGYGMTTYESFNRRGDSLGGATAVASNVKADEPLFQSQRRFFGGSNVQRVADARLAKSVSIAEAILWGEQRLAPLKLAPLRLGFNRRGDSLGGATDHSHNRDSATVPFQSQRRFFGGSNCVLLLALLRCNVSIAEAILWGEQPSGISPDMHHPPVSIAEAILWGEQPRLPLIG